MVIESKETQVIKNEPVISNMHEKRPPSSLSTGSSDSGVFSSGALISSNTSQPTEPSSAVQTGPPSPSLQINSLLYQTASLIAVNEQLRKEKQGFGGNPVTPPEHVEPLTPANQQNTNSQQRAQRERRAPKPESYKTVICQAWLESKTCSFAENCRFAHGEEELRPSKMEPKQNNKYKTKLCEKYTTTGLCPYGKRCLFIHPDHGPNAYIRPDKLFEVSQRHALADLRDQMEAQILSGNRMFSAPPPSTNVLGRPSTPTENLKNQPVPLGPTPVSLRGARFAASGRSLESARPPSSWPLEPTLFGAEASSNTNGGKITSRPASPFESMVIGSSPAMMTMMGKNSTPGGFSGYVSGGSTPYTTDLEMSPYSPAAALVGLSTKTSRNTDEDSFSMVPGGFDHLAEDMAKHLELW